MKKWEYERVIINYVKSNPDIETLEKRIDTLGLDGWEMFSAVSLGAGITYIFKREVNEQPT